MYCAFCKQPINPAYPATYFMSRWWHVREDETGEVVPIEESCWGKSDFGWTTSTPKNGGCREAREVHHSPRQRMADCLLGRNKR
jgi:hypothetical protein